MPVPKNTNKLKVTPLTIAQQISPINQIKKSNTPGNQVNIWTKVSVQCYIVLVNESETSKLD